ncbi:hypothetical protein NJH49_05295 [Stenotrophomonas maltophilia]|uniref:hypothetical protein n=1 Tax=Stenotrophomonas maltophilia TaxID=40324 RepID=UPI002096E6C3|nr:hypothetical protein [Stenotrophomonas maltophilia]MCO7400389.1 hypothetical protein [Stenotrophomonas maltophilia]MCO7410804.1 hypothetical protein [Stenotrophomonas maltophilia]
MFQKPPLSEFAHSCCLSQALHVLKAQAEIGTHLPRDGNGGAGAHCFSDGNTCEMIEEVVLDLHQHPVHPALATPACCSAGSGVPSGAGIANFFQRFRAYALDIAGELFSTLPLTAQLVSIIEIEQPRHVAVTLVPASFGGQPVVTRPIKEAAY